MEYSIEPFEDGEGGYCEFYNIVEDSSLGFKSFSKKCRAIKAYNNQKKLSKFGLAPKVVGQITKLPFYIKGRRFISNWGYITQKADEVEEDYSEKSLQQIQKLVEKIYDKTQLKFWDCHWWNIGIVQYRKKPRVVCIDTGSESFIRDYNAWGFNTPGPKCDLCDQYQCKCGV